MSRGFVIGFARVSTQDQDLSNQLAKLQEYGCDKILSGKHSGKAESNKEALKELMSQAKEGDTVVVTTLDRLGRSLSQVLQTLDHFKTHNIAFKAIEQEHVDTTKEDALSVAMIHLLGVFSELERNFIVERTQRGRLATGRLGGRKRKLTNKQRDEIRDALKKGESKSKLSKQYGVTRSTILNIERETK